ncbi:MAG: carbon-nitrogen hydrolase family protein [Pseudomonadota bacterium]
MTIFRAACIQLRSGVDVSSNIAEATRLIETAAADGAKLIATPEMTGFMDIRRGQTREKAVSESQDEALKAFRALAAKIDAWLLVGSLAVALEDEPRCANRSFLIAPSGDIAARYDKIHMFDVDVGDGQSYRESRAYRPGDKAVVADTPYGVLGLTVCYDLRFPTLYRALAAAGAQILTCPAAFTRVTGEAHWDALLRARAIETGSFMLAPAQGGRHEDGRETYGHSRILSPWGEILAAADDDEPGFIAADIDLNAVEKARTRIPSLTADQPFTIQDLRA